MNFLVFQICTRSRWRMRTGKPVVSKTKQSLVSSQMYNFLYMYYNICPIDLFFRKNPFNGEFTIFAGLSECLKFLENFRYSESDINYLRQTLPQNVEDEFFQYLRDLTPKDIKIYALQEGSIAFPRYWHFCIFPEFSVFFTECWTYPEAPLLFSVHKLHFFCIFQDTINAGGGSFNCGTAAGNDSFDSSQFCQVIFKM